MTLMYWSGFVLLRRDTKGVDIINIRTNPVFTLLLFTLLGAFFLAGCTNTKPVLQEGKAQDFVPARHLVFIGLDGWGGAYVPKANMPTVKRMMSGGTWSLDVQCVMPGNSWPNWTSLFCCTPPEQRNKTEFPSIFTLVKNEEQTKKYVLFYEWNELQKICPDEAAEKQEIVSDLDSARKAAAYIIKNKPVFSAAVFNEPDSTGHNKRWGSAAYYAKLTELDGFIAVIEQAVKDAGIYDSTVFILSADHGGSFRGHGANFPKQRKIPVVIYGGGIKEGFVIVSPVSICDIAPTMAAILGVEIPSEWTGRLLQEIFK
jgi:predicted AlkP superfamily pyrophosphatase or phosphodiesterase